ncbi:MAG: cobalamin biosynthesis protein [Nitrospinae bacterium]|nr:cobalamin biosynthesis protein [Nitrospinota bacterium]
MKTAFITLSNEGARLIQALKPFFPEADAYLHERITVAVEGERFDKTVALTERIFGKYEGLVYIAPCGAVVRALAGVLEHKTTDPAVVVVDAGGRHAVSLLSGHEGGANDLAVRVANAIGAEPVISTTTEAVKNIIAGVGCRKGKQADDIVAAIRSALGMAGVDISQVRYIASADVKNREEGLIEAAHLLGVPLRFIASEEIRASGREFARSEFVEQNVNLPAVAEPAALLAGRRTTLLLQKTAFDGITVALAKENCLSLA